MNTVQIINTLDYHKNFEDNQLKVHNKIANFIKWVVQATGNKLEKIGSYIRHPGKAHQGPSLAERSISVRVNSAKDMHDNNYLMLGSNKNFRAYRNSLDLMDKKHPDADAIVLCGDGNKRLTNITSDLFQHLPNDTKKKCINVEMMSENQNNKWDYRTFDNPTDVHEMVYSMFETIISKKHNDFQNCKEIKLIIETPPFITTENTKSDDCAYSYIMACEAWMLHMQTKYNKKVTILPFRNPETLSNIKDDTITNKRITNNNKNYDNANATIATKTKKDRVSELKRHIDNYILKKLNSDEPFQNYSVNDFIKNPQNAPAGLITGKYNDIIHSICSASLYKTPQYVTNIYNNAQVIQTTPSGNSNFSQYIVYNELQGGVMENIKNLVTQDSSIADNIAVGIAGNDGQPLGGLVGRLPKRDGSGNSAEEFTLKPQAFTRGAKGGQEESTLRECIFNIIKDDAMKNRFLEGKSTQEDKKFINNIIDKIFKIKGGIPAHGLINGNVLDYRTTQKIDYTTTTNPLDYATARTLRNIPTGIKNDAPKITLIITSPACCDKIDTRRPKRLANSMVRTRNKLGYKNEEFRHETIKVALRTLLDRAIADKKRYVDIPQYGCNTYAPSDEAKNNLKPNGKFEKGRGFIKLLESVLEEKVGPKKEQRWQYFEKLFITGLKSKQNASISKNAND